MSDPIQKVSIIVSKGSLEGVYPALIMANGARAEGIEANLFFTFFGLDVVHRSTSTTSRWPPSEIPASTWPPSPAACQACRRS